MYDLHCHRSPPPDSHRSLEYYVFRQITLLVLPGVLLMNISRCTAASEIPVVHLRLPLSPSYGPTGYLPSTPMPTLLAPGGAPTGRLTVPLIPPRMPPRPPRAPAPPRPGISKSGLFVNIISLRICVCCWIRLGGPRPVLNAPPPSCGRQLGLTPRWETEVKLLVSDSAGERAPSWRFS
jgi:hypothetical protein